MHASKELLLPAVGLTKAQVSATTKSNCSIRFQQSRASTAPVLWLTDLMPHCSLKGKSRASPRQ